MNWLERGCVRVVPAFKLSTVNRTTVSSMLRQGHLSHASAMQLLDATSLATELEATERKNAALLNEFTKNSSSHGFRPSLLLPFSQIATSTFGSILSLMPPATKQSYAAGVKLAIADYYNDQIREIYAEMNNAPETNELKELFKELRDAELEDIERIFPSIEDAKNDKIVQYARQCTQIVLTPSYSL
ncbi:hypothetical protein THRCLA_04962 [Thraustotheca clavata]|uniref:Uncharacterized protein n=1 Tax=Thraustotheca clavata TaxID=74557 RepID=A0A1V9ZXK7_9STRA|nr:hypothetical protein THRCLA_04962 [Thraustotheca clavata]